RRARRGVAQVPRRLVAVTPAAVAGAARGRAGSGPGGRERRDDPVEVGAALLDQPRAPAPQRLEVAGAGVVGRVARPREAGRARGGTVRRAAGLLPGPKSTVSARPSNTTSMSGRPPPIWPPPGASSYAIRRVCEPVPSDTTSSMSSARPPAANSAYAVIAGFS